MIKNYRIIHSAVSSLRATEGSEAILCAGEIASSAKGLLAMTLMIFSLMFCGQAFAATVTVGPEDSSVIFNIRHELGYTVGYFKDFKATLETGDAPGKLISLKAEVATGSVTTRNDLRDEGLRSQMFLDSAQFPRATFESTAIDGDKVEGTVTIKGVSHPVTLTIDKDAPAGKMRLKGEIDRNDFGITYNKPLADKKKSIGDIVTLIIELKV